jgi:hypothetical protein
MITVRQYYTGFVSLLGVAAGLPFVPPILHVIMPDANGFTAYLYPPLGDFEWIAVAGTIGFLLMTTYTVFTYCRRSQRIHPFMPTGMMVVVAVGICALIAMYVLYVRRIPVESKHLDVAMSVGSARSDFAINEFENKKDKSDWDILHKMGPTEQSVQLLWKPHSILKVRMYLWLLYTLVVSSFVAVISLAVYEDASAEATRNSQRVASANEAQPA